MSGHVDVLAAIDYNLKDRAERAARYGKKSDEDARRRGARNIASDRKADFERHLLEQLSAARAAVSDVMRALDDIGGLSTARRAGGPDPMDLEGLDQALATAIDTAHVAIARLEGIPR